MSGWNMQYMEAGSQYEGRNPDGSSFRSHFPMDNHLAPPIFERFERRGNNGGGPPPPIDYKGQRPNSQPLRNEVGDTFKGEENSRTNGSASRAHAARTKQRVLKRYIWRPTSDAKSRCEYDG